MLSNLTTLLVGLGGLLVLSSPLIPLSWLFGFHAVIGSGRWAALPPYRMGLPLFTACAVIVHFLVGRRTAPPLAGSQSLSRRQFLALVLVCLLLLVAGGSLLWTPSPDYGAEKFTRLLVLDAIPALFLFRYVKRRPSRTVNLLMGLAWLSLGIAVLGLVAMITSFVTGSTLPRGSVFGTDPITYGTISALGALLWGLGDLPLRQNLRILPLRQIATISCAAGLIASGSKGPVVAALIAYGIASVHRSQEAELVKNRKRWRRHLIILLSALGALVMVPQSYQERLDPAAYSDPRRRGFSTSITLRQQVWAEARQNFEHSPVWGGGLGSFNLTRASEFGRRIGFDDAVRYPHNLPLEVATELGILGLLPLAVLGLVVTQITFGRSLVRPEIKMLLVVGFVTSLSSGDLSDHRLLWFGVALCLAAPNKRRNTFGRAVVRVQPQT